MTCRVKVVDQMFCLDSNLRLLVLSALLWSVAAHTNSEQGTDTSERFLNGTERGRIVLTYLRCSDLDCVESLKRVVELGRDAVAPLINLLQHPVPQMIAPDLPKDKLTLIVQTRVINALGKLKDERAVEVLASMGQNKSPQIRAASTEALAEIATDRAFATVISRLQDDDQLVRETAAKALGKLQRRESLAALYSAAAKEKVPHVRQAMEAAIKSIELVHPGVRRGQPLL
jgi:HEAT repeats